MQCTFPKQTIEETIRFHGHNCPGLAIGIRAAEYAKREFSATSQTDLVCVTETDMCGVDAIQYLTGCTCGKGNLIHRDYGKIAFSFFDRNNNRGFRIRLRSESWGESHKEMDKLMLENSVGSLTKDKQRQLNDFRAKLETRLMELPLQEMFTFVELKVGPPRPARVLQSLSCDDCCEQTMESRTRRFAGRTLCIPCYQKIEQKI